MDTHLMNGPPMIVSASYNDAARLGWWQQIQVSGYPHMLYHKDDSLAHGSEIQITNNDRSIANFGKSNYAFLHHIVQHWDELADHTVFVKANWWENAINLSDVINQAVLWDYLDAGTIPLLQVWNPAVLTYIKPSENIDYNLMYGEHLHGTNLIVTEWFAEIFPDSTPPDAMYLWGHGPCFSASRRTIHRHPRAVWKNLYDKLTPSSQGWHLHKRDERFLDLDSSQLANLHCDMTQRFWRTLFTHGADPSYRIRPSWIN
jgi:hypothetical protein